MHCNRRLIVQTLVFSLSYLHSQVSPPEILVVKGETTWARNGRWILPENARLPRNILGSFTCRKSTTRDKRLYFPSEGKRAEDFFAPEKSDVFGLVWTPLTWVPKARTLPLDHRNWYFVGSFHEKWLLNIAWNVSGYFTQHVANNLEKQRFVGLLYHTWCWYDLAHPQLTLFTDSYSWLAKHCDGLILHSALSLFYFHQQSVLCRFCKKKKIYKDFFC